MRHPKSTLSVLSRSSVGLRQRSQGTGSAAAMEGKWVLLSGLLFAVSLLSEASAYNSFTVGDDAGWRLVGAPNYTAWAAKHNYSLGDSLIFNFQLNHSVVHTLDATTYNACNFTDGDNYTELARPGSDTFVNFTLTDLGLNYFGCPTNESDHCKQGMKFAVSVNFGVGLPPPPPAAPPPSTPAPPGIPDSSTSPPPPSSAPKRPFADTLSLIVAMSMLLLTLCAT